MQCKDIPNKPILEFLLKNKGQLCNRFEDTYEFSVQRAMPNNLPPNLVLAKMKQMIKTGLVKGCACGCRGDFRITDKGIEYIKRG